MISSTTNLNNQSNGLVIETPTQEYMREYVDYLDHAIDFPELTQIRQLDISLQNLYQRLRQLVEQSHQTESPTMLIDLLIQIKNIGDKKMQLSQQMLDATERQSRKLKIAQQKYIESINQSEHPSNEIDSDNEDDSETGSQRSLSTKSLWKRKTPNSTLNTKRKCALNSEQIIKKPIQQRTNNSNTQNSNGKKLRLNNDSSNSQSDETTYCLCSQLSYGQMILCDNKTCEIKWFHFNCVNLNTKPKGKWFCPACRENRN